MANWIHYGNYALLFVWSGVLGWMWGCLIARAKRLDAREKRLDEIADGLREHADRQEELSRSIDQQLDQNRDVLRQLVKAEARLYGTSPKDKTREPS